MRDGDETRSGFLRDAFLAACLLWASVSPTRAHDERLILIDHVRKARWVGTPEQLIDWRAQDMEFMERWFIEPVR